MHNRIFALLRVFAERENDSKKAKYGGKFSKNHNLPTSPYYAPDDREACSARRSSFASRKTRQNSLPRTLCEAKRVVERQIMILVTTPCHIVLQRTLRTLYGSKGQQTLYGKISRCESIQTREEAANHTIYRMGALFGRRLFTLPLF